MITAVAQLQAWDLLAIAIANPKKKKKEFYAMKFSLSPTN